MLTFSEVEGQDMGKSLECIGRLFCNGPQSDDLVSVMILKDGNMKDGNLTPSFRGIKKNSKRLLMVIA